METETIASRNVIDLLLNEEFQTSICGARISGSEGNVTAPVPLRNEHDFIYGWDCWISFNMCTWYLWPIPWRLRNVPMATMDTLGQSSGINFGIGGFLHFLLRFFRDSLQLSFFGLMSFTPRSSSWLSSRTGLTWLMLGGVGRNEFLLSILKRGAEISSKFNIVSCKLSNLSWNVRSKRCESSNQQTSTSSMPSFSASAVFRKCNPGIESTAFAMIAVTTKEYPQAAQT